MRVEQLPVNKGFLDFSAYANQSGIYGRAEGGYHFSAGSLYGFAEAGIEGRYVQYQAGLGARFSF